MTGVFITNYNIDNYLLSKYNENNKYIYEAKQYNDISIQRLINNKFLCDKVFFENEKYIVLLDGVVLNSLSLAKGKNVNSLKEYIELSLKNSKIDFYNDFRGSFCGCIVNRIDNSIIAFTNHTGDRPLFYYQEGGKYVISSNVKFILDFLKSINKTLSLNKNAIYYMITWGNMIDDSTYANEIKRVLPGEQIVIHNSLFSLQQYYKFRRDAIDTSKMTDDEIVEQLDKLFVEAVDLEYSKDKEYGYRSLAHLSGGLDSRMSNFVARELQYDNILNLTYTQSNSNDEKISKKIAVDLENELFIRYMDIPKFIYDVDKVVEKSGGLFVYIGMTNGLRCLEELNTIKTGILHTGLIGDVVLGTLMKRQSDLFGKKYIGAYSQKVMPLFKGIFDSVITKYEDYEMFYLNTCALLTNASFPIIYQDYTEFASPFMYKDFVEFCYCLNINKRIGRYIYLKWIREKHPKAGNYIWTSSLVRINAKFYKLKRLFKKVMQKIKHMYYRDQNDMNPFNKWYNTNDKIRGFIDKYISDNINLSFIDDDLKSILNNYLLGTNCIEKLQLMTALSSIKMYFGV